MNGQKSLFVHAAASEGRARTAPVAPAPAAPATPAAAVPAPADPGAGGWPKPAPWRLAVMADDIRVEILARERRLAHQVAERRMSALQRDFAVETLRELLRLIETLMGHERDLAARLSSYDHYVPVSALEMALLHFHLNGACDRRFAAEQAAERAAEKAGAQAGGR